MKQGARRLFDLRFANGQDLQTSDPQTLRQRRQPDPVPDPVPEPIPEPDPEPVEGCRRGRRIAAGGCAA